MDVQNTYGLLKWQEVGYVDSLFFVVFYFKLYFVRNKYISDHESVKVL